MESFATNHTDTLTHTDTVTHTDSATQPALDKVLPPSRTPQCTSAPSRGHSWLPGALAQPLCPSNSPACILHPLPSPTPALLAAWPSLLLPAPAGSAHTLPPWAPHTPQTHSPHARHGHTGSELCSCSSCQRSPSLAPLTPLASSCFLPHSGGPAQGRPKIHLGPAHSSAWAILGAHQDTLETLGAHWERCPPSSAAP